MEPIKEKSNVTTFTELSTLKERLNEHTSRRREIDNTFPNPMYLEGDGIDHINIWDGAETELGEILSHGYQLRFHHSMFGSFYSIETFWYYIQSKERDDQIRSLAGRILKNFANDKSKTTICFISNFRAIIADTQWQRISSMQPLVDELIKTDLPFDCYYINAQSGVKTRPIMYRWICAGMEEIRKALKENRLPDFTFLLDDKNTGIYEFVNSHIKPIKAVNKEESLGNR